MLSALFWPVPAWELSRNASKGFYWFQVLLILSLFQIKWQFRNGYRIVTGPAWTCTEGPVTHVVISKACSAHQLSVQTHLLEYYASNTFFWNKIFLANIFAETLVFEFVLVTLPSPQMCLWNTWTYTLHFILLCQTLKNIYWIIKHELIYKV